MTPAFNLCAKFFDCHSRADFFCSGSRRFDASTTRSPFACSMRWDNRRKCHDQFVHHEAGVNTGNRPEPRPTPSPRCLALPLAPDASETGTTTPRKSKRCTTRLPGTSATGPSLLRATTTWNGLPRRRLAPALPWLPRKRLRPREHPLLRQLRPGRAIQYGVGPIGASITRLMREKQAIEIIGAIDTDPAKVGARPGRSCRSKGCSLGRNRFRGSQGSAGASRRRGNPFHVVVARKSDGPVADVPGSRVVHRFDLRGVVVPVSDASELAARLDTAAKEWGVALVGTGVNPGFVMDKLVVTLAAVSPAHRTRERAARGGRVEAAAPTAEKNRRGNDSRRISRTGEKRASSNTSACRNQWPWWRTA